MSARFTCPRCGDTARPPGLWSDSWTCATHGGVAPLHPPMTSSAEALAQLGARAQVPLWVPWPLPSAWLGAGVQVAGDEHQGHVAVVTAFTGPNLLAAGEDGLAADLLVVAEQPGVGLGARLAGVPGPDPGGRLPDGPAPLHLPVGGHEVPLWPVQTLVDLTDSGAGQTGVAYVGEAAGEWLWLLIWPQSASAVLLEPFELVDVRWPTQAPTWATAFPEGALSTRLPTW